MHRKIQLAIMNRAFKQLTQIMRFFFSFCILIYLIYLNTNKWLRFFIQIPLSLIFWSDVLTIFRIIRIHFRVTYIFSRGIKMIDMNLLRKIILKQIKTWQENYCKKKNLKIQRQRTSTLQSVKICVKNLNWFAMEYKLNNFFVLFIPSIINHHWFKFKIFSD